MSKRKERKPERQHTYSYEGTRCRCDGKKLSQTLICAACEAALSEHPSLKTFNDSQGSSPDSRRHAAIVLLTLASKRKHQQSLPLEYRFT